jgi:hypothetical protein
MQTYFLETKDKVKIAFRHYKARHEKAVVIAHGFFNSKDAVVLQKLKDDLILHYDVFMFDFRGHGESAGNFSWTSKEEYDIDAVFEYLKVSYKKIGYIGFSLGGSIAINYFSKNPLADSLICISSPSDLSKVDYRLFEPAAAKDVMYALFQKDGKKGKGIMPGPFWLKKRKPSTTVKKLTVPVSFITGDGDWLVKPWHSKTMFDKTKSEKELILLKTSAHAEYLLNDSFDVVAKHILSWFASTL